MQATANSKTVIESVTLTMTLDEAKLLWELANRNALEIGARERGAFDAKKVADLSENIYQSLSEVYYEPRF
jgi:hypothetical protein